MVIDTKNKCLLDIVCHHSSSLFLTGFWRNFKHVLTLKNQQTSSNISVIGSMSRWLILKIEYYGTFCHHSSSSISWWVLTKRYTHVRIDATSDMLEYERDRLATKNRFLVDIACHQSSSWVSSWTLSNFTYVFAFIICSKISKYWSDQSKVNVTGHWLSSF